MSEDSVAGDRLQSQATTEKIITGNNKRAACPLVDCCICTRMSPTPLSNTPNRIKTSKTAVHYLTCVIHVLQEDITSTVRFLINFRIVQVCNKQDW